jgi:hypothetical protein
VFTIGVKNYRLTVLAACGFDPHCPCVVNFSYALRGDFLCAAQGDNLKLTVDYSSLSQMLARDLLVTKLITSKHLKKLITNFSKLIKSGSVELELTCPHTYVKEQSLL